MKISVILVLGVLLMETSSGSQSKSDAFPSLLDKESISARKRYRRMYHRVMSGLEKRGSLRLLTLTSSQQSGDFQNAFRRLRMRLLRRNLLIEYIRCPELTKSGLRHEHILFRGSYIEQLYISHLWNELHQAPVVYIQKVHAKRQLASYLASYLSKSPAGRYSYSFGWVWRGFAASWTFLKKISWQTGQNYRELLTTWKRYVSLNVKPDSVLGWYWLKLKWRIDYVPSEVFSMWAEVKS